MGNWTPGPWEYIDASKSARYRFAPNCVIRGNGKQIASFSWGDPLYWPVKDESQANARLISSAPELLEKVRQYASECAECEGLGYIVTYADPYERGDASSPLRSPCADCADIRAVIAKATGEKA